FDDLHFLGRRMLRKKLRVVRDACELALVDVIERVRERHVAEAVVMSVRLTIRRDVHQLRMRRSVGEGAEEAVREVFAAGEELLERDRARNRPVVEKDRNRTAGRKRAE